MAGVRVYELARDLGVPSKNLIEELRNQGIEVKSHMSTMDEETAGLVLDLYRPQETTIVAPPLQQKVLLCPLTYLFNLLRIQWNSPLPFLNQNQRL
jgi:hypothetical protein